MKISVVAAAREDDRPPDEVLVVASLADRLGYGEVWVGEGPTWDAIALGTAIGLATRQATITLGPVPVSVRDPATIARGAASVAAFTRRPVGVALGTSSTRVVEGFHGRSRAGAASLLGSSAQMVRELISPVAEGTPPPSHGFRRRLPTPGGLLTIAAFGDRAIAAAAEHADRMLLDVVSPEQVAALRAKLEAAAQRLGRTPPTLAAWLPAAVEPEPESYDQLMRSIVGYLTVRGYRETFVAAGFGDAVRLAAEGASPDELVAALPRDAAAVVGLAGDRAAVATRLQEYERAGLDEVALVPATAGDPAGERTLTTLAPLARAG